MRAGVEAVERLHFRLNRARDSREEQEFKLAPADVAELADIGALWTFVDGVESVLDALEDTRSELTETLVRLNLLRLNAGVREARKQEEA